MAIEQEIAVDAWLRIEAWLIDRSPLGVSGLNAPATDSDMTTVESATRLHLPRSLRAVLTKRNGESASSVFGGDFALLSAQQMIEHWHMHVAVLAHLPPEVMTGEFDPDVMAWCDSGVKPLIANRKWLPFADSNGDITRYIDFDPTPSGQVGQVIEVDPEATVWRVLAPSFVAFLVEHARLLEAGELDPSE